MDTVTTFDIISTVSRFSLIFAILVTTVFLILAVTGIGSYKYYWISAIVAVFLLALTISSSIIFTVTSE